MNNKKLTTRDRILEAATKVFAEKGFAFTTIAEIALVAHVSEASVHDHFSAKEELFHAIPAVPSGSDRLMNLGYTFTLKEVTREAVWDRKE